MSRRNPPAKWSLPTVVHPVDSKCYFIRVPNDDAYLAAFTGALYNLTTARFWQDDLAHTALDVAKVWRSIFDNTFLIPNECDTLIEFRQSDNCTLQSSIDGGLTWTDIFNAYNCAYGAANTAIDDALTSGKIASNPQPSGQGQGTTGQCYDFVVTLTANQVYTLPISVITGDVVSVTNAVGAWSDGAAGILSEWRCPNGAGYALGECMSVTPHFVSGDPMPTANHMRLICSINGTNWQDVYNTNFVVPTGITDGQVLFQANDSPLNDNFGGITFQVSVCKVPVTATLTYLVGSGVTTIAEGQEYVFTLAQFGGNPNYHELGFTANKCFDIVITGTTGFVSAGSAVNGLKRACGAGAFGPAYLNSDWPTESYLNQQGFDINSYAPTTFSMKFINIH